MNTRRLLLIAYRLLLIAYCLSAYCLLLPIMDRSQPADLEIADAGRCLYFYLVAFFLTHQGLPDRRNGRDQSVLGITLFRGHQPVTHFFFPFDVEQHNA